jgi:hypothetical protein
MGKSKKSSKKLFKKFMKSNRVLLAALSGTAAGIAIASIIGTEKAKQIMDTIDDSVNGFKDKISNNKRPNAEKASLKHSAG